MSVKDKIKLNESEERVAHAWSGFVLRLGFVLAILLIITLIIVVARG